MIFFYIKTQFSNIKVSKQTEARTPTTQTNLQDVSLHEKQMDTLHYTQRRSICSLALRCKGFLLYENKEHT